MPGLPTQRTGCTRRGLAMQRWVVMSSVEPARLGDHLPFGLTLPRFLVSAYGPTLLASLGFGAVIPMLAIQALALGANHALAALIAALVGIGQVLGDLPAGVLTDRFGERRALAAACLVDAGLLCSVFFIHQAWLFAIVVFVHGLTGSVFGLARQTYLTVAVPLRWRARAMSSLGGVMRIGYLVGPLVGALIMHRHGLTTIFLLAGAMAAAASVTTMLMPDLPANPGGHDATAEHVPIGQVLRAHRRTLLTIGWGVLALMLVRTARQVFIPLWCNACGMSLPTTNLVYSGSMAGEVLLFFPGGLLMDRLGRWWSTVPTIVVMAICFAALPASHTVWTITAWSALLGIANGLSSGVVMTLGADLSPAVGRPQFLAGWRVFSDIGSAAGPLVISVVTALVSLSAAAWALAVLGWLGGVQLARFLPRQGPVHPSLPQP